MFIFSCNKLQGFTEGEIHFKPTFKFDPYTSNYDTSHKQRTPAWCDRILWNSPSNSNISQVSYVAMHGEYFSDHRAVISEFDVSI